MRTCDVKCALFSCLACTALIALTMKGRTQGFIFFIFYHKGHHCTISLEWICLIGYKLIGLFRCVVLLHGFGRSKVGHTPCSLMIQLNDFFIQSDRPFYYILGRSKLDCTIGFNVYGEPKTLPLCSEYTAHPLTQYEVLEAIIPLLVHIHTSNLSLYWIPDAVIPFFFFYSIFYF